MKNTAMRLAKTLAIALVILGLGSLPTMAASTVKSFYFYPANAVVIDKSVTADLLVVGGDVVIKGSVTGNVSVLGGDVHVNGNASVTGDTVVIGGELLVADTATVLGNRVVFASVLKRNHTAVLLLSALFWLLTIGFGYYFFPERIEENAFEFGDDFIRAVILGIYATALLFILSVLSFVLVQVVVGIFMLIAVLLFAIGLYLFSILTVFQFLGELIWKRMLGKPQPGLIQMTTGLIIYEALAWLGFIGLIGTVIMVLGAIGASLLSRFGTFKPWFGAPRYWGQH